MIIHRKVPWRRSHWAGDIIDNHEFEFVDEDYDTINKMSANRWSAKKGGAHRTTYDGGIINTSSDPHRAERWGLAAEIAYGLFYDEAEQAIDGAEYKEGGDGGYDLIINGAKIDVKATGMPEEFWVTTEDKGRKWEISADEYVGAHVSEDDPERRRIRIMLMGRISKESIKQIEDEPGRRREEDETHMVKKVRFTMLDPLPERSADDMSSGIDVHE